ncbi:MAG TPA: GNAT family N-acetyltransferase [Jatrophihabitans sp.]|jgi:ribosomal protein S18 acetylase RimI-like enzyme
MTQRRPSHRQTLLLGVLVLAGWIWDLLLGGGKAHSIGWLVALLLVVGISALTVRSRKKLDVLDPVPETTPNQGRSAKNHSALQAESSSQTFEVRPVEPDELAGLIDIELAADKLFEVAGYGATPGTATIEELQSAAALMVAGRPAVGYIWVEIVDGLAHIQGLSVKPKQMKRGVGGSLLEAACEWAREHDYPAITLCTFAEVPWNAPYYARRGFVEVDELSPGLTALRAGENEIGLDAIGRRIAMRRECT